MESILLNSFSCAFAKRSGAGASPAVAAMGWKVKAGGDIGGLSAGSPFAAFASAIRLCISSRTDFATLSNAALETPGASWLVVLVMVLIADPGSRFGRGEPKRNGALRGIGGRVPEGPGVAPAWLVIATGFDGENMSGSSRGVPKF